MDAQLSSLIDQMPVWDPIANQWARGDAVILPSSVKAATGNGGAIITTQYGEIILTINVTAKTGTTPTLDVTVETADDVAFAVNKTTAATFTQVVTGTSLPFNQEKISTELNNFTRVLWTIGGTAGPSWTFSATGILK